MVLKAYLGAKSSSESSYKLDMIFKLYKSNLDLN